MLWGRSPPTPCLPGLIAVIADQRVGHGDDLAGIGRVGKDFLIAAEGGIEDNLADSLAVTGKRLPRKGGSVFQGDKCFHGDVSFLCAVDRCEVTLWRLENERRSTSDFVVCVLSLANKQDKTTIYNLIQSVSSTVNGLVVAVPGAALTAVNSAKQHAIVKTRDGMKYMNI